jgi:hypothetical protein
MYLINAHVLPTERLDKDKEIIGAYAALYIDYKDIDGAFELAKYYIDLEGWKINELEDEYFILNSADNVVEEENRQYYHEALEYGYSLVFFTYKSEDDDEVEMDSE